MDLTAGYIVEINEPEYVGYPNSRFIGMRSFTAQIIKESYGAKTGQHTFTLLILDPGDAYTESMIGKKVTRKGRNLYKYTTNILAEPVNKKELADEKHQRAEKQAARNRTWGGI